MFSAKCANVPVSRWIKSEKKIDWKHKNSNLNIATNHMDCLFLSQLIWIEFVGGPNMQSKLSNIYWNELTNCHRNKTLFCFQIEKLSGSFLFLFAWSRHEAKMHSETPNDALTGTRTQSHFNGIMLILICAVSRQLTRQCCTVRPFRMQSIVWCHVL